MIDSTSTNKLIRDLSKKFDKKFGEVDSKFNKIDSRFNKLETSLDFVRMDIKNVEK